MRPIFSKDRRDGTPRAAIFLPSLIGMALLCFAASTLHLLAREPQSLRTKAPEIAGVSRWLNSDGFKLADQRGKVIVLHFWTFGGPNCRRNLPYYNKWREDYSKDEVQIVGIHTPETSDEADLDHVAEQVKKLGIKYPVAVDSDNATWRAYENRYWPSIYLIDRRGNIRYRWDGELEYRDAGGDKAMRAKIEELLAEGQKS